MKTEDVLVDSELVVYKTVMEEMGINLADIGIGKLVELKNKLSSVLADMMAEDLIDADLEDTVDEIMEEVTDQVVFHEETNIIFAPSCEDDTAEAERKEAEGIDTALELTCERVSRDESGERGDSRKHIWLCFGDSRKAYGV